MNFLFRVCAVVCLLSGLAFAQNFHQIGVVQSRNGFPAPGALVAVCTQPCTVPSNVSITTPPSPLASLCSSLSDLVCTSPNPVTADGLGNYGFYVLPGTYTLVFYGSGLTAITQTDVLLPCTPASCAAGNVSAKSYNNVVEADTQTGATVDARLGVAIGKNITATGGTSDARGEVQTGTLAAETDVGNASFVPVSLMFPPKATWTYTGTDGTSCAFKFFSGSSGISPDDGGAPKFQIQGNASTNADSLICTDPNPSGGGGYYHLAGIAAANPASIAATYANGLFHFQKMFDNSVLERLKANNSNGTGFQFDGGCCAGALINSTSDGAYGANAAPCVFGVSTTSGPVGFDILNSSCDHPGVGKNNILVQGGFFTGSNRFSGVTYIEASNSDTTTPPIQIATNVRSVAFDTIKVGGTAAGGTTACVVDIATGVGGFGADQINVGLLPCAINDHVHNLIVNGLAAQSVVPGYRFGSTPTYLMSGLNTTLLNIGTGSAGTFTNTASISAAGNATFNSIPSPGAIGGSTPAAGTFTTLTANTSLVVNGGTALTTTNQTGTGNLVLANTPTLITPVIGAATGTSLNVTGTLTAQTSLTIASSPAIVSVSGNSTKLASASGSYTSGNTVKADASGNLVDAGSPPVGFTSVNVTPVTANANTAADQNLQAITITAGVLNSIGKSLLIQTAGVYSTPAGSTSIVTLKAKLCTVSGCGSGTVITLASIASAALGAIQATNDPFNLTLNSSTQTAGASASFEAHGNLTIDISALTTAAEAVYADGNTTTVGTIDSSAQLFLQITGAFSNASGSNSITERQLIADVVD